MKTIQQLHQMKGHKAAIYDIVRGKEQEEWWACDGQGWLVKWDLKDPENGVLMATANKSLYCLHHMGGEVLGGDMDGKLHWIIPGDQEATSVIDHHLKGIFAIKEYHDRLFTIGGDGVISEWDKERRRPFQSLRISHNSLRSMVQVPGTEKAIIGASDHHFYLLDLKTWEVKERLGEAHSNSIFAVAFDTSGRYLVTGGRDAFLMLWDAHNGYKQIAEVPAHLGTINKIAIHPKGHIMATASRDKTVKIWSFPTLKLLKVLEGIRDQGHVNSVNTLVWVGEEQLLTAGDDRTLILWQVSMSKDEGEPVRDSF